MAKQSPAPDVADMERYNPRQRGFIERYQRNAAATRPLHLTATEWFTYNVMKADFEYGHANSRDSDKVRYYDFTTLFYADQKHRFTCLREHLNLPEDTIEAQTLRLHYEKKFSPPVDGIEQHKALNRSELYYTLQGITDFTQADDFHRDVAFSLEAFDMCTYIENDVYDKKHHFKEGNEAAYFDLSQRTLCVTWKKSSPRMVTVASRQ